MEDKDLIDWMLWIGEQREDFLLEWNTELPELHKQDDTRFEYNQWRTTHCTLYAPIWAISDLFNMPFSKEQIKWVVNLSVERGKPINKGWYTQKWVKCAVDRWNKYNPTRKTLYFRSTIWSNTFNEAIEKWYTVVASYRGNRDYGRDYYDWVLEWTEFKPSTYWHCISLVWKDWWIYVKDNYKWRKWQWDVSTNYYKVKDIKWLVKNKVFYPACYIIVKEDDTKYTEQELKRLTAMKNVTEDSIQTHSDLRALTNDEYFRDNLHERNEILREKIRDIQHEINKLI